MQYLHFYIFTITFQYFSIALNLAYTITLCLYKTLDYWSRDMLNFHFLEKGLGIVSPPHFVHDFSRRMFLMLYSLNCLSDWLYFLRYWTICILQLFVNQIDVMNFEISLIFLIKLLFCMTEKSRQKFKCLDNEKSF